MTLRIGDKVIIASKGKFHKPDITSNNNRGQMIDIKWNMAFIRYNDGATEWIELNRVYKAVE